MRNNFYKHKILYIIVTIILSVIYGCGPRRNLRSNELGIKNSKVEIVINELIKDNQPVSLVVVCGQVKGSIDDDDWKNRLQNLTEICFMNNFKNKRNFALVTRNNLNYSIEELILNQSGLTSNSTRLKIGELTGATHILVIEASLVYTNMKYNNFIFWKLVDLQSGKVLAIDQGYIWQFHL